MYQPPKIKTEIQKENLVKKLFNLLVLISLGLTIFFWILP